MKPTREQIRRLMLAINVIDGICTQIAKTSGTKENTLALFYALDDGLPHSQKEISDQWLISKTTLNTIVKECIDADLIYLNIHNGKKEKEVCLTEKGKLFAKTILSPIYQCEENAYNHTMHQASACFIDDLEQFATHFQKEAQKL